MKILRLNVSKLRGIVDIELNLNGQNAVIWGPNGVGKSAVVDAIDFLFTGDITRLRGEATGDVSVKTHGPHVSYTPSDAVVSAIFQIDDGRRFTASRSVADKSAINVPDEYRSQFEEFSKHAANGAHFLSRRELLRYILTTPKSRSDQIQTLLDITDLKTAREVFVKLAKKAKTAEKEARQKYDNDVASLKRELTIDSSTQLLDSINNYRSMLGGGPLVKLEGNSFISGLTYSDTQNEALAKTLAELECFHDYLPNYITTVEECITAIQSVIDKIEKEEGTVTDKNSIALVKAGIDLLSGTGVCPLCLTQWATEDELKSFLLERKRRGETISSLLDDFSANISRLDLEIQKYKGLLTSTIASAKMIDSREADIATLQNAADSLKVFYGIKGISVDSFIQNHNELEKYQREYALNDYLKLLNGLIAEIKPQVDSQSRTRAEAWQKLNNSNNLYSEICKYKQQQPLYQATTKKAEEVLSAYEAAQEERLNILFHSISNRFAVFYQTMHHDDEGDFSVSLENAKSGINLNVDFYGLGQYPPMAYHSEGHQDSMGIALFFALMESLTSPNFEVVVLDDVVMSVDIEHRKNFCKILKDFFGSKQFIITTHDQVWARHLISSGIVPNSNYIHFSSWSVDAGPMISIGHDIWNIAKSKADISLNEASAFLRREMECFFESVCDELIANLPYNSAHKWDFGQYMNAAHSKLKELYIRAKKHSAKFSNTDMQSVLERKEAELKATRAKLDSENWITNMLVHYNPQYIVSKTEFLSALSAMENYCRSFQCSDCNTKLHLTLDGVSPSILRCRCGKNMYPM